MNKLNIFKYLRVILLTFPLALICLAVFRSGEYSPALAEGVLNSVHLPINFFADFLTQFFNTCFNANVTASAPLILYFSYVIIIEIGITIIRIPLIVTQLFEMAHNAIFKE